jgi:hypothetical protein
MGKESVCEVVVVDKVALHDMMEVCCTKDISRTINLFVD